MFFCGSGTKKPDGTFTARNAIRGFMQVEGKHYDDNDKSSPVATEVAIRIVFVLVIMAGWYQHLVDVEGAFLNGYFEDPERHKIFMKVRSLRKMVSKLGDILIVEDSIWNNSSCIAILS